MSAGTSLIWNAVYVAIVILTAAVSSIKGGCEFKDSWQGSWFLSGVPNLININLTHIQTKGECYEEQHDKFLVYDKTEDCFRCLAIHEKAPGVLQYKETYCEPKASLQDICYGITGDAYLFSMFRKYPEPPTQSCPFRPLHYTFSYNRGTGDCNNPPSTAESCIDPSRMILKHQACPDISSTESNVEELVCLASWKEGSTKYLIGKIQQANRRSLISDEDQYRCFIFQRSSENTKTAYDIAQSGDATCSGVQSATEGSKTMRFVSVDNHHNRCRFPAWIHAHHTWYSLDHQKQYRFTSKNATLLLKGEEKAKPKKNNPQAYPQAYPQLYGFQEFGFEAEAQKKQNNEMRLICHNILESVEQKRVQIVAHITAGCDSGYICMVFYKRDSNVIEVQQSEDFVENPDEACSNFDQSETPFTTLTTTTLHPKKCPHLGRYTIFKPPPTSGSRRKKRQQIDGALIPNQPAADCLSHDYEALAVGCGALHEMEFRSSCSAQSISAYSCHGSWEENGVSYVIASPISRKSTDAPRYCFIYTVANQPETTVIEGSLGRATEPPVLRLSGVSESCHRDIVPGVAGNWAFNFTINGTCASENSNSSSFVVPTLLIVLSTLLAAIVIR